MFISQDGQVVSLAAARAERAASASLVDNAPLLAIDGLRIALEGLSRIALGEDAWAAAMAMATMRAVNEKVA